MGALLGTALGSITGLLSLFGVGSHASPTAAPAPTDTPLTYAQAPPGQPFDWTANVPEWKAIGITMLVLLALGAWEKTREFATIAAVAIGVLLLLGRYA